MKDVYGNRTVRETMMSLQCSKQHGQRHQMKRKTEAVETMRKMENEKVKHTHMHTKVMTKQSDGSAQLLTHTLYAIILIVVGSYIL